jgi:predicted NBD/HSP70 family sugar kinase
VPGQNLLRELSEQAVLEAIFRAGPLTRPEIAARTSLSKPTVSAAVERLVEAHLVKPAGERPGRRGRTPLAFVVDSAAGYVIGVDLGSTRLRVEAVDIYGERLRALELETVHDGPRAVEDQIAAAVERLAGELRPSHRELLSLGVSTPGVVDPDTSRVTSLAWHVSATGAFDSLGTLTARFGVPVLVENDINMAAIGEKSRGRAGAASTFVFVSVGAGVGMGIVIDDELFRGFHGAAGEIGYLPLVGDPFDPRHRLHGGLEDEVAAAGVLARYNQRRQGGPEANSAHDVFELAGTGDRTAREVVDHVASLLGAAIATVCAILDPGLVVLGGGIGASPLLLRPVRGAAAALVPITARIETSLLGDRAALQGAIAVALQVAREQLLSQGVVSEARKNVAGMRPLTT